MKTQVGRFVECDIIATTPKSYYCQHRNGSNRCYVPKSQTISVERDASGDVLGIVVTTGFYRRVLTQHAW